MGTHVTIDDDVARAPKQLAHAQKRSLDAVISDILRRALPLDQPVSYRNGLPQLPYRQGVSVTTELVDELRDEPTESHAREPALSFT
ncbi:MAG: CopG family transcriptional regulator [Bosea sp. (in: a-proteobacteria)]